MSTRVPAWTALVVFLLLPVGVPALGDSASPTTYRSRVTDIVPPVDGVTAEVVGGDAFLRLHVEEGVEVEVPGYEGEPYIRVGAGGEVEVNRNSPSHWINEDRYGRTSVPETASADAPPRWERVDGGGSYGWHDHRIHWMSPDPPPSVDRSRRTLLYDWSVPIVVDGRQAEVVGALEWVPPVSPLPWVALAAVTATGAVLGAARARWVVAAAAALAAVVGLAQAAASPLGPWQEAPAWMPPVAALALAALRPIGRRPMALGAGTALLLVWAGLRLTSLWSPVLPTPLPAAVERSIVAVAAGAALGALVAVYRRLGGSG